MSDLNNLKSITQKEFNKIVDNHVEWIKRNLLLGNKNRLYLYNYNLSNLKIKNKNLYCISFYNCLFNDVVFKNCNLIGTNIKNSKFTNTNFVKCKLSNGFFNDCKFKNSNLSTCYIEKYEFNFERSVFDNTTLPDYSMVCPEKGNFIGYKKVRDINDCFKRYILKLEIPEDARRSSSMGNKCRCDKVKVLEIQNLDGSIAKNITEVRSIYNDEFIYKLDETVEEPKFDECRWHECTAGIHFFMNRKDVINYLF